jgi:beta-lactamase class A
LNKINHALYVYTLAERGFITLDTVHTFSPADRRGGTGIIQNMAYGSRFTTRELLRHSMVFSCNVAARMLIRYTAGAEFSYADFVYELGANPYFIGNIATQNTDVFDKFIWMYAVHNYIWSDGLFSDYFQADLFATPGFIRADYPMARKYGWARPVFNDAAVVYAPSPYVLIILSNMYGGAAGLFRNISYAFQEFNRAWF